MADNRAEDPVRETRVLVAEPMNRKDGVGSWSYIDPSFGWIGEGEQARQHVIVGSEAQRGSQPHRGPASAAIRGGRQLSLRSVLSAPSAVNCHAWFRNTETGIIH